jgi:hypothetical protein
MEIESTSETFATRHIRVTEGPPLRIVDAYQQMSASGKWGPPELSLDNLPDNLTRSNWEVFKRMIDAAFNAFEEHFPS